ncbi:MAG: hypothetical protein ACKOE6_10350 [Flammeovirgaceae bacterium]
MVSSFDGRRTKGGVVRNKQERVCFLENQAMQAIDGTNVTLLSIRRDGVLIKRNTLLLGMVSVLRMKKVDTYLPK